MYLNKSFPYLREIRPEKDQPRLIPRSQIQNPNVIQIQPLSTDDFFVESIHDIFFLRHTSNRLFCNLVRFKKERTYLNISEKNTDLMTIHFELEERLLAFKIGDEYVNFVDFHISPIDFNELPDALQDLYLSALLLSNQELVTLESNKKTVFSEERINRRDKSPNGRWESSMFNDVFDGDSNSMTDDEYEMIYGESR